MTQHDIKIISRSTYGVGWLKTAQTEEQKEGSGKADYCGLGACPNQTTEINKVSCSAVLTREPTGTHR